MKSLILSDSDRLIKFILFGETPKNENDYDELRHIPSSKLWPEVEFLKEDDLDIDEKKDGYEKIKPKNNMELAIYHCKGNSQNLLI